MKWSEYRKEVSEYRKEKLENHIKYAMIMLLGIREKYDMFMVARKEENVDKQIEEYGNMLFCIAELSNVVESHFDNEFLDSFDISITEHIPRVCVSAVSKYLRDENQVELHAICLGIISKSILEYVCTITAEDAMKVSLEKLKELRG